MQTITLGPTIGDRVSGVVLALEVSPLVHERFEPPVTRRDLGFPVEPDRRGPSRYVGLAATVGVGSEWHPAIGFTAYAAVGIDFLPYLFESGLVVGFGGQIAYATGAVSGLHAIAPRLWCAFPVGTVAGAPALLGLMLRGQFGLDGANGAGPSIVLSRISL